MLNLVTRFARKLESLYSRPSLSGGQFRFSSRKVTPYRGMDCSIILTTRDLVSVEPGLSIGTYGFQFTHMHVCLKDGQTLWWIGSPGAIVLHG